MGSRDFGDAHGGLCHCPSLFHIHVGLIVLNYHDMEIGKVFQLGPKTVTADEIVRFAEKFDPQPFHLDPASPQAELTGGLIASGWHTCSIFMRMMCDAYILNSTSQGSGGLDEVRWLKPVRPNDTLSGTAKVVDKRISKSRPEMGIVHFDYELHNQNKETVMTISGTGMIGTAVPQEAADN